MLALFAVFEHLSNVRRLLSRFHILHTSPARSTGRQVDDIHAIEPTSHPHDEQQLSQQRDILLAPILSNILSDHRLNQFDVNFQDDLHQEEYFARELDACLLEMREIERDLYQLKQRQCSFYEQYLDFIDKKDELIDMFIEYHDEYLLSHSTQSHSPTSKQMRRSTTSYEFNIPVSNRFELLRRGRRTRKNE
jgi:hypothetical protein